MVPGFLHVQPDCMSMVISGFCVEYQNLQGRGARILPCSSHDHAPSTWKISTMPKIAQLNNRIFLVGHLVAPKGNFGREGVRLVEAAWAYWVVGWGPLPMPAAPTAPPPKL